MGYVAPASERMVLRNGNSNKRFSTRNLEGEQKEITRFALIENSTKLFKKDYEYHIFVANATG